MPVVKIDDINSTSYDKLHNSKPFYYSDLSTILKNISTEKQSSKSVLENLITDRTKTQKAAVKALLEEIQLREKLDSHLLEKIHEKTCLFNTYLIQLENICGYWGKSR